MDFQQLRGMTIAQLREVAEGVEGLTGYTEMRKNELLAHICQHLNIAMMHGQREVVRIDKSRIKKQIRELKHQRDAAIAARDQGELKRVRRHIHRLKRRIRQDTA